jgi:hypothetical protein
MNPNSSQQHSAFLFVAAWAALGFADALLCLIGAAVVLSRDRHLPGGARPRRAPAAIPTDPPVRLAERTNPLLGSVTVNTPRGDGSEAQLRSAPNPPLSVGKHALDQMMSRRRGTRPHATDLPKHRTARRPSTAAHPTEG